MCGRSCLTLHPDDILCACKYKSLNNNNGAAIKEEQQSDNKTCHMNEKAKITETNVIELQAVNRDTIETQIDELIWNKPEWRAEFNCGRSYIPSYNIAPTDITPVLVSSHHFDDDKNSPNGRRVLVPMMWGMIPFWHKGDYKRHGLTTNNCRLEHMSESKLYAGPFRRGQRCVILCEGFYEWQTTKSAKPSERAAYLVYMPQKEDVKIYDKSTWKPDNINLLKMAGLFDVWTDENGDKIYSYSVITYESTEIMSWMHHRMPAILETEQQVNDWLDFNRVTDKQALAALSPAKNLKWHRVSNTVNNSRNKSEDCNKPNELIEAKRNKAMTPKANKNKTLLSWLNVRKRREESLLALSDDDDENSVKSLKSESDLESQPKRPKYREFKKSFGNIEEPSEKVCRNDNSKN